MGIADGKRALVVGVANDKSLAWSIAQELKAQGAEVALTYQGEVLEKRVRPLAESDRRAGGRRARRHQRRRRSASTMSELRELWGGLDLLVHAVAFADREDLRDRFLTVSRGNFAKALEISAYSLVALARAAEPLMEARGGGSILTLSYLGAVRAVPNYNVMGVAKAALEACVRYLAVDLGPKNIRVNAISAAPARTLSSSAIRDFFTDGARGRGTLADAPRDEDRGSRQDGGRAAERPWRAASPARRFTSTSATVSWAVNPAERAGVKMDV